jgi:hypothetical protein
MRLSRAAQIGSTAWVDAGRPRSRAGASGAICGPARVGRHDIRRGGWNDCPWRRRHKRPKKEKVKANPMLVATARELRDRWLEKVNDDPSLLLSHTDRT